MNKKIAIPALTLVFMLSMTAFMPLAFTTKPIKVKWTSTSISRGLYYLKQVGKTLDTPYEHHQIVFVNLYNDEDHKWQLEYTGDISGISTFSGYQIRNHEAGTTLSKYFNIVDATVTVDGKEYKGTLEMRILGDKEGCRHVGPQPPPPTPWTWECESSSGTWTILRGTGDLENLRGHGTRDSINNYYEGFIHFDP